MSVRADGEAKEWAFEEFGHAELGDARRTWRLVQLACAVARKPAGCIPHVVSSAAARQGAYDFVENDRVAADGIRFAMRDAAAERARETTAPVFVVVDGSSLNLADWKGRKDFGSIGAREIGGRGLKVITALALTAGGTPLGILDQQWWARSEHTRRRDCQSRPISEKETRFWVGAIEESHAALSSVGAKAWFVIDREGDRYGTLGALARSGQDFTLRSTYAHRRVEYRGRLCVLGKLVSKQLARHAYEVALPAHHTRRARTARIEVKTLEQVKLRLFDTASRATEHVVVNVVEAREIGPLHRDVARVHWRLFTTRAVGTTAEVEAVLRSYTLRWRIEDFHRTWKSGACNVEDNQLQKSSHVIKWAMILAANAARIERIKHLARHEGDRPATDEFTAWEIEAAKRLFRRIKSRVETVPDTMPSMRTMTYWIARLGGFCGTLTRLRPGSITIGRGLPQVLDAAALLEELQAERKPPTTRRKR